MFEMAFYNVMDAIIMKIVIKTGFLYPYGKFLIKYRFNHQKWQQLTLQNI